MRSKLWYEGVWFYYRNQSTGAPTKRHIMRPDPWQDMRGYCGFQDEFWAQGDYGIKEDNILEIDCCKRCLKAHFKSLEK